MKMLLLFSPFALVEEGLISLLMLIDAKIYGLFAKLYSLYLDLAMARIFDISTFDNVIKNVYVIFGVVALFIVVFSLLQAMVNPEDVSKGTKTTKDVIKRLILCVGLTCVVPFAFDFLYDFQFSLLKFQVIPKTMIGVQSSDNIDFSENYTDADGNQGTISGEINASDFTKSGLQVYGNQMAFYVLNGFFFANDLDNDGTPDEVIVEASEHFGSDNGLIGGAIGCIGGVVITGILALTGVGIPAAATTGAGTAAICAGGVVAGVVIDGTLETITAEEFSWRAVSQNLIPYFGEFDLIAPFSEAVVEGTMSYTPIISTIAGIIMLYMMFSFCLDLGVRAAKLVFYQIMAPISFLLSILPKNKDLMSNWFKAVLSTWAEVFVRIICVCGAALLISNLNFEELNNFGLVARAIIVLGIVAFAKQAPKLFGEVTGIKSGNLKLGIKDKLAAGGAFTAGAIVGGGLTAGARNLTNAGQNVVNKYQQNRKDGKGKLASAFGATGTAFRGAGSIFAGTISGAARSGKSGWTAKSAGDMKGAATKGAAAAVDARENRAVYKSRHGGTFVGAMVGHAGDTIDNIGRWAGFNNIEVLLAQQKTINELQSQRKSIDNEAFDIIDGDFAKGKQGASLVYDKHNAIGASLGITHSMDEYRELKAKLDKAKVEGNVTDIQKYDMEVSSYRKKWADELADISLKGESHWSSLDESVRAELSKLRIASDTYRENVSRNYTASYVSTLTNASDILDKEKDLTVKHATLDDIKNKMKIEQTGITNRINQIRQKEQDKKGK